MKKEKEMLYCWKMIEKKKGEKWMNKIMATKEKKELWWLIWECKNLIIKIKGKRTQIFKKKTV